VAFVETKPVQNSALRQSTEHLEFLPYSGLSVIFAQLFLTVSGMFFLVTEPLGPLGLLMLIASAYMLKGYFLVQSNEAKLIIINGLYKGSVSKEGFYWTFPNARFKSISLKTRVLSRPEFSTLDKEGLKIYLPFGLEWKITEPSVVFFGYENFEQALENKVYTVIRSISALYPYQSDGLGQVDFSDGIATITQLIGRELSDVTQKMGIKIIDLQIERPIPDFSSNHPKINAQFSAELAKEVIAIVKRQARFNLSSDEEKALFLQVVASYSGKISISQNH
jgi:regulator of protease activity HflC (stomatin/prohibitin superfamily)